MQDRPCRKPCCKHIAIWSICVFCDGSHHDSPSCLSKWDSDPFMTLKGTNANQRICCSEKRTSCTHAFPTMTSFSFMAPCNLFYFAQPYLPLYKSQGFKSQTTSPNHGGLYEDLLPPATCSGFQALSSPARRTGLQ